MLIKNREKNAIIESLRVGIVPRIGLQHIQVGRKAELEAIIHDFDLIKEGCAKTRFIIGDFGSGKTFFLTLAKLIALQKNMVVLSADITTDRYLCSSGGQAKALYSNLLANLSVKSKPDGGALSVIIERWIEHNLNEDHSPEYILKCLKPLEKYASCFDFAKVISEYATAYLSGDDIKINAALRWLRGEYSTKTEARLALGVRTIISDENYYDYLRLFAKFTTLAGYSGVLINIDELAVLARLRSTIRSKNFEKILTIINDTLQGETEFLYFLFGGTTEFLEDKYRGLYSYGALTGRLAENPFSTKDNKDFSGPVIRLDSLSQEELYVLLSNIRNVFALGDKTKYLITDEQLTFFMHWILDRLGASAFLNPRDSVKTFTGLLSQIENHPDTTIETYLGDIIIEKTATPNYLENAEEDDDLNTVRL